ncbi:MAG: phospholipase C [Gaiellaceae bacterium]
MSGTDHAAALAKVEHIVVLMLENRSFDHMLGYLSLEGGREDVDGLKTGMANEYGGRAYPIHHLDRTAFLPQEDPDHSGEATSVQIAGGEMSGFVDSFAAKLAQRARADLDPGLVMGYYDAADLPVYDHLAAEFCVCDRWFSSVPGATWPNRLYAIAGRADGTRDDKPSGETPLYDLPSFVRHLDAHDVSWRWYSYDPGTLRCVDRHYWLTHYDRFAYVDKTKLSWKTELEELPVIDEFSSSFLEDAAKGKLPAVSWIDPNFKDLNLYGGDSNDDHPPSDVHDGQLLVLSLYHAIASGPLWEKTLFVITYDEHGGFFDHVPPPPAEDDDPAQFGQYGIRVPAIVVSPWVGRGSVSHTVFDHTSIIKTILLRFCGQADLERRRSHLPGFLAWLDVGHPHYMGKRTAEAAHLGELLTEATPRSAPAQDRLVADAAARKAEQVKAALTSTPTAPASPLTELQVGIALAARELRGKGLPPAQP